MSKRKIPQTLLIIAACLVVLSSCFRGGSEMKRMVSPSNKTILELSTKNYDDEQLFSMIIIILLQTSELNIFKYCRYG